MADGGGIDWGGVLGDLFSVGGDIASGVWGAVQFVWGQLGSLIGALTAGFESVASYLGQVFAPLGRFADFLWTRFFRGVLGQVWAVVSDSYAFLYNHAQQVIGILKRVRRAVDAVFKGYIKPILDLLQHARQFLRILKLLHVQFAAELDKKLAAVEGEITRLFFDVRGHLNAVINFIQSFTTGFGLLRRAVNIAGLNRDLPGAIRSVTGYPLGWFAPNYRGDALPGQRAITSAKQLRDPAYNPDPSAEVLSLPIPSQIPVDPETGVLTDDALDELDPYAGFDEDWIDAAIALEDASYDETLWDDAAQQIQAGNGPVPELAQGGLDYLSELVG